MVSILLNMERCLCVLGATFNAAIAEANTTQINDLVYVQYKLFASDSNSVDATAHVRCCSGYVSAPLPVHAAANISIL